MKWKIIQPCLKPPTSCKLRQTRHPWITMDQRGAERSTAVTNSQPSLKRRMGIWGGSRVLLGKPWIQLESIAGGSSWISQWIQNLMQQWIQNLHGLIVSDFPMLDQWRVTWSKSSSQLIAVAMKILTGWVHFCFTNFIAFFFCPCTKCWSCFVAQLLGTN